MPLWEEATKNGMKNVAFDVLPLELEFLKDGYLYGLLHADDAAPAKPAVSQRAAVHA